MRAQLLEGDTEVELFKVKRSEHEIPSMWGPAKKYVALYTDTGLKSRFTVALKLIFKEKPLPEKVLVQVEVKTK